MFRSASSQAAAISGPAPARSVSHSGCVTMMASVPLLSPGSPPKFVRLNPGRAASSVVAARSATRAQRGDESEIVLFESSARLAMSIGEPPVEEIVICEIAVASQAVRTGRVAGASVREIDEPVVKLPVRVLDDHLKKLLADRRLAKMSGISGAVLKRVAEEYLADDRTKGGIFLASDTRLQLIVLNIEIDSRRPSKHERERVQG